VLLDPSNDILNLVLTDLSNAWRQQFPTKVSGSDGPGGTVAWHIMMEDPGVIDMILYSFYGSSDISFQLIQV
jgi:hypothetical protein